MAIAFRAATSTMTTPSNGISTLTAGKPTGTVLNDLMLAYVAIRAPDSGAGVTVTAPSGWTQVSSVVDEGSTQRAQLNVYRKIAGGSEPADYTWSTSPAPAGRIAISILSYSGVDVTTPIGNNASEAWPSGATTSHSYNFTTTGSGWVVSAFTDIANSSWVHGQTQRGHVTGSTNTSLVVGDSNGTVSAGVVTHTAEASASTSLGASSIVRLVVAASSSPPDINTDTVGARYVIDARSSVAGSGGGALSFGASLVSGEALAYTEPTEGLFFFEQEAGSAIYRITLSEAGGASVTQDFTIPATSAGLVLTETVIMEAGEWV